MLVNLLETSLLPDMVPSSDYLRRICTEHKCPHPWLIELSSSHRSSIDIGRSGGQVKRHTPISRLYGLCRPHGMRKTQRSQQSSSEIKLSLNVESNEDSTASASADGCSYVIQLSTTCHEELFRSYFGEDSIENSSTTEPSIVTKKLHKTGLGNASCIIPDHSRLCFNPAACQTKSSQLLDQNSLMTPSCDRDGLFRHVYVLLPVTIPGLETQVKAPEDDLNSQLKPTQIQSIGKRLSNIQNKGMRPSSSSGRVSVSGLTTSSSLAVPPSKTDYTRYYLIQVERPQIQPFSNAFASREKNEKYNQWEKEERLFHKILGELDVDPQLGNRHSSELSLSAAAATDASNEKRKWDPKILSTLCRWRACLAEALGNSNSKHYCAYHADLKRFLDFCSANGASGNVYDASKFTPKKPPLLSPNATDRDLRQIRAASSLLQEISDGKLKGTVFSYVHKMCTEMALRSRLNMNSNWCYQKIEHAPFCHSDIGVTFGSGGGLIGNIIKSKKGISLYGRKTTNYLPENRIPQVPQWAKWKNIDDVKR